MTKERYVIKPVQNKLILGDKYNLVSSPYKMFETNDEQRVYRLSKETTMYCLFTLGTYIYRVSKKNGRILAKACG